MSLPSRTLRSMSRKRAVTASTRCALVGAAVALTLAGCGGGNESTSTKGQAPAPAPTPTQTQAAAPKPLVIEVQRGVGGATLGMSAAQVKQRLGEPLRADQLRNSFGPYTEYTYPDGLTVAFQGGAASSGASSFFVKGRSARTPEGIGVGSTAADVDARVARSTCEKIAGYRSCHVGEFNPGATVTDFQLRGGRVASVRVALVFD